MQEMETLLLSLLLFQVLVPNVIPEQVHYVTPNTSSPLICPGKSCLTLDQYLQQEEIYFATESTFIFMPGNHSLQTSLNLADVADLTLTGFDEGNDSDNDVNIVCRDEVTISLSRVTNTTIIGLSFIFGSGVSASMALFMLMNSEVCINKSRFQGSGSMNILKTAIHASYSRIEIENSTFHGNTGEIGGAIRVAESNVVLSGCSFIRNQVVSTGGTIYALQSSVTLNGNVYTLNSAGYGGVLACDQNSTIKLTGINKFIRNSAKIYGGALYISDSRIAVSGIILFLKNTALGGGALSFRNVDFQYINNSLFENNSEWTLYFEGNEAQKERGGAMLVISDKPQIDTKLLIKGVFINNTAGDCGGAMYLMGQKNIVTKNISIRGSKGNAICMQDSEIRFTKVTRISNNTGQLGGCIFAKRSSITFIGSNYLINNTGQLGGCIYSETSSIVFTDSQDKKILQNNQASHGGAIYSVHGTILLGGSTFLIRNSADEDGGALYAVNTESTLQGTVQFNFNSANRGGAMYFKQAAGLLFVTSFRLTTAYNYAHEYGGAIFHDDVASPVQCNYIPGNSTDMFLPYCFYRLQTSDIRFRSFLRIYMSNNTAGNAGNFLYGGLLDRCQMNLDGESLHYLPYEWLLRLINARKRGEVIPFDNLPKGTEIMTSLPYQLCFCDNNLDYSCSETQTRHVYRGQTLSVSVLALDQTQDLVPTTIKALVSSNARIKPNQDPQFLPLQCYTLTYNVYSTVSHEQLVLYADGPCRDNELARVLIDVTLLPCPDAFTESGDSCVCEERLQEHAICGIEGGIYIKKKSGSKFWMSAFYDENSTYRGLILYNTCPKEYCRTDGTVRWTLDSLNNQCDLNRSGVLCGACATNYSLMLGSNKCQVCSNTFLSLLVPFAAAGVVLVAFLSILRLTVSTGMINSVIFYANIVQVNKDIFLSSANTRNVLTVFIAWVNLDLGYQTCFYNGMDAYAQTWLQFAFPIYVWILISLIIVTSRYSITMSKLIGHNPISVLATLLLMSYTKVLKITIEVYSSVNLDYPGNKTVTVWLKDANVPYLQSRHLLLTVVTTLVLVFLFIPYTLLLLFGSRLYRLSGRNSFMNRLKPLLDSYYAPYTVRTRYWTGFLLLSRCALYIVFSYNSLGGTTKSLLAIQITLIIIFSIAWLSNKIYKRFLANLIEATVYVNLVTLSGLTLARVNSSPLVYSLIGIVFATTISIIVHHFSIVYIAKSGIWLKVKVKAESFVETLKALAGRKDPVPVPFDLVNTQGQLPHQPVATKSVIDLREPLLEN